MKSNYMYLTTLVLSIVAVMLAGCKKEKIVSELKTQDNSSPLSFVTSELPATSFKGGDDLNQMEIGIDRGIPYSLRNMEYASSSGFH